MSLYVTSVCNLECKECIMMNMMKAAPKYQMPIDEVKQLIKVSEASNYTFDFVLTGGEPFLYKHILDALRLLRASRITKSIVIFSNAMFYERLNQEVIDLVDSIRVSHYLYNDQHVEKFKSKYPGKVTVVERTEFWPNPQTPLPPESSNPVECLNPEVLLYDYNVYACPHSLSIVKKTPHKDLKLCNPLEAGFLDGLKSIKDNQHDKICNMCLSNNTVRKNLIKGKNISLNQI